MIALWWVLGAALGGILTIVGLYQIEIMWIKKAWNEPLFEMPFCFYVRYEVARDIWYSCVIGGWFLTAISLLWRS